MSKFQRKLALLLGALTICNTCPIHASTLNENDVADVLRQVSQGRTTEAKDYNNDGIINLKDAIAMLSQIDTDNTTRYAKMDSLINKMMLETDPTDGSMWNTENTGAFKWSYINGCMVSAFIDLYKTNKEANSNASKYLNFADTYISAFISTKKDSTKGYISSKITLSNYALDDLNSCKALMDINKYSSTNKVKYNLALNDTFFGDFFNYIKTTNRTAEGNFWHKKAYPYQVWLDGTYMAMPTWLEYEIENDGSKNIDAVCSDITSQFRNVKNKLRDSKTGLYYHGYDAQADSSSGSYNLSSAQSWAKNTTGNNKGCSSNFWLRGFAWYSMALIDTIEMMPEGENRNELISIFKDAMDTAIKYQDEGGMWYQVMDNPVNSNSKYNYLETSGSAGLSYSLMKGSNLGILDSKYYSAGLKAFNSICDNKLSYSNSEITLSDICGVAGLAGTSGATSGSAQRGPKHTSRDGSYDYYVSEKIVTNDAKGIAPLIFAYCEVIKHSN